MGPSACCKNLWLIILLTLIGGATPWILEYYLAPKYTATGYLQILPPSSLDPFHSSGDVELSSAALVTEQHSRAQLMLSDSTLSSLLQSPIVRETDWFARSAGDRKAPNVRRLKEQLRDNLAVTPVDQSALLQVSFRCSVPADGKKIVEELVHIYLDQEREVARGRLDSRTRMLRDLRSSLNAQLKSVSDRVRNQQAALIMKGLNTPGGFSTKERELSVLIEAQLRTSTQASDAKNMFDRASSLVAKGEPLPEVEKAIENDPSVAGLVRDISALKINREVAADTTDNHSNLKKLDRLIELTQAQLDARRQELRVKYTNQVVESLKDQVAHAQADLEPISKRIDALRVELADLGKEVASMMIGIEEEKGLRERRTLVEDRLRDIEAYASPENQMRINWASDGKPEVPDSQGLPRLFPYVLPGLIIGFALGLLLALLRSLFGKRGSLPREIGNGKTQTAYTGIAT